MYTVLVMAGSDGNPSITGAPRDLSRVEYVNSQVMQLKDALPGNSDFTWSILSDGDHDAVMFRTGDRETAREIIRITRNEYLVFVQAASWDAAEISIPWTDAP